MVSAVHAPESAHGVRASAISLCVALTIHSVAAIAILRLEPRWNRPEEAPVEIDVSEPPPPPETKPAPEPAPEPVQPKPVRRQVATREFPRPETPSPSPPPPNQEPRPNTPNSAPPVFGVTMSSVVSGEAAMAVPVGNTTMTKPQTRTTSTPPAPEGTKPFIPVHEIYVATPPRVLYEVTGEDVYPIDAKALGIEGRVRLSVGIDQSGRVVEVRTLPPRAGHGFDEAAAAAMKRFLFSPARTSDGRAVPYRWTHTYTFTVKN